MSEFKKFVLTNYEISTFIERYAGTMFLQASEHRKFLIKALDYLVESGEKVFVKHQEKTTLKLIGNQISKDYVESLFEKTKKDLGTILLFLSEKIDTFIKDLKKSTLKK